jgi:hypothetical protein
MSGRGRCPDCAGGIFEGNGKCGKCDGTGINTQLDSDQPKCPYCAGTGTCSTCGGSGFNSMYDRGPEIQKLFD